MAAMNGIPTAMFYLGDIYYNGKYNVEIDKDQAISYYKEAAKNDKLKINKKYNNKTA
nr:13548_t:CDS:2 [Entrophospora candida]